MINTRRGTPRDSPGGTPGGTPRDSPGSTPRDSPGGTHGRYTGMYIETFRKLEKLEKLVK